MQDVTSETKEYIYDNSSLQLAAKVGFIGVIMRFMSTIILEVAYFDFFNTPFRNVALLNYQLTLVNFVSISWLLFMSMGYLGIFVMKQNKLAALFPFLALLSTAGFWIYTRILWEFVPDYGELLSTSQIWLGNIVVIITALALLTIRDKSANPKILYSLVIMLLTNVFLVGLIQTFFFGYLVSFGSGVDYLIYEIPRIAVNLIMSSLIIGFFKIESMTGCEE